LRTFFDPKSRTWSFVKKFFCFEKFQSDREKDIRSSFRNFEYELVTALQNADFSRHSSEPEMAATSKQWILF
jgi:hypothetical protein